MNTFERIFNEEAIKAMKKYDLKSFKKKFPTLLTVIKRSMIRYHEIQGEELFKKAGRDSFIQGYVCAVCNLIRKDGLVNTEARELFREGVGKLSLADLKRHGVDDYDLTLLRIYWNDIK